METTAGLVLVGLSVVAACLVHWRPGPTTLDLRGFTAIAKSPDSALFRRTTDLGTPVVLVIATVAAGLVAFGNDRRRAVACLAGPVLVAVLVELVIKPLVGRHYQEVLSYPSGNVADLAAVATAWSVAVPPRLRPAVVAVGAIAVAMMMVAVIGLRWHYPTDALAGAVLGVGAVLLLDGLLHLR